MQVRSFKIPSERSDKGNEVEGPAVSLLPAISVLFPLALILCSLIHLTPTFQR